MKGLIKKMKAAMHHTLFFAAYFLVVSFCFSSIVLAEDIVLETTPAVETVNTSSNTEESSTSSENPTQNTSQENSLQSTPENVDTLAISQEKKTTKENPNQKALREKKEKEAKKGEMKIAGLSSPSPATKQSGDLAPSKKMILEPDLRTGALVYDYSITTPKGRNGMESNLSLEYNSQDSSQGSIFGNGWSVNIPYIVRLNKTGTGNIYSSEYFNSSLSGKIVSLGNGEFGAKSENGNFLKYTLSGDSWTVKDKNGVVYSFGKNDLSRQNDPEDPSRVYKWMLEEIRDANNNFIRYEYFKDSGQIYPSKIIYTGNGTTDGIFEVEFLRSTRGDVSINYSSAFSVTTSYLISEINVKVNASVVRKYTMNYIVGSNTKKSLLSSITETGFDESSATPITLSPTKFEYNTSPNAWTNVPTTWKSPVDLRMGVITADVNGDGLTDILQNKGQTYPKEPLRHAWINTGSEWVEDATWFPPADLLFEGTEFGEDLGVRAVDLNGDNFLDLIQSNSNLSPRKRVFINNGNGWTEDKDKWVNFYGSINFLTGSYNQDGGGRIFDVNGDGLPDLFSAVRHNDGQIYTIVQMNTGSGWATPSFGYNLSKWKSPVSFTNDAIMILDLNGDGLTDFLRSYVDSGPRIYSEAYLNTGSGWALAPSFAPPEDFIFSDNDKKDYGIRAVDINTDNLPDLMQSTYSKKDLYINTGNGWKKVESSDPRMSWLSNMRFTEGYTYVDGATRLADLNGDGLTDIFKGYTEPYSGKLFTNTNLNTGNFFDAIKNITYPAGGTSEISYKNSTQYKDINNKILNPKTPFIMQTVEKISTNDGFGNIGTTSYTYKNGFFYFKPGDFISRKFAGFGEIIKTDPVQNITKTYFHQGNSTDASLGEYNDSYSKMGRVYREEKYDNQGNIFSVLVNRWDSLLLSPGREFVKNTRTTNLTYDGNTDHRDTAREFSFDNEDGSMTLDTEWGEVIANTDGSFADVGGDMRKTSFSYAKNENPRIVALSSALVSNQHGNKVREEKYYYDNLSLGSVSKGNRTKVERWKTGSTYINEQKSYNTFGLVTTETDPNGNTTTYTYDPYNLYPETVANPLNHILKFFYDYSSGKAKKKIDQNNFTYETTFDGFDRVLEEKIPGIISPYTPVVKTSFVYNDTPRAVSIKRLNFLDSDNSVETWQYFDGFLKLIQERTEMENPGEYSVRDMIYNNKGLLMRESIPWQGFNYLRSVPLEPPYLHIHYSYDAMERPTSITNILGTTAYSYNDWTTTITDANGKVKKYHKDAYGNLVKVDEILSGTTYSTNYGWNANGNLINITDAMGNIRNFTYDGLGLKLSAQDLHAPTDTTFGTWTYTYDNTGNMIKSISPMNHTVNYTYNAINQRLTEDSTGNSGMEIAYVYGGCANGIGKLCTANMVSGTKTSYTYDSQSNVKNEIKNISSVNFITSYAYDRQGNRTSVIYPDSSELKNTFNSAGLLEKIEIKEKTGPFTPIISQVDYNPASQPEKIVYGNGVTTQNNFDSNKFYLLKGITTQNTASLKIQDVSYAHDNTGNITKIIDNSSTNAKKVAEYVYDDLYRLTSASITSVAEGQTAYTESYTYDILGNILTSPLGIYAYKGNTGTLKANPHATTAIGPTAITYDANGNIITNGFHTNNWNYKNELTRTLVAGVTSNYIYDHEGSRMRTVRGSTTTLSPNKLYNTTGSKKTKNIYFNNKLIATIETNSSVVTPYYVHTDHLNSTSVVTDKDGKIAQTLDYYPYGGIRINKKVGSFDSQRQYIGEMYDSDTTLNYLNARYYDNKRGRFISEDPLFWELPQELLLDPQQQNSYSYGRNNPINLSDPTGKAAMKAKQAAKSFMSSLNAVLGRGNTAVQTQAKDTQVSNTRNSPIVLNSPVGNAQITSPFKADRSNCSVCSKIHGGTDYSVKVGTPVYATAPGVVDKAYESLTYGKTIVINHGPSSVNQKDTVYTIYAHGDKLIAEQGQYVKTMDLIMYSGKSGPNLTGPHLHYEVISTSIPLFGKGFSSNLDIRYEPNQLINLLSK